MSSSDNSFQDWKPMILNKSNAVSNSGSKSESQKSKTKVNISEEEARAIGDYVWNVLSKR